MKPEFEVEIAELAGRPAIHRKNRRYPEPRVSGEKSAAMGGILIAVLA